MLVDDFAPAQGASVRPAVRFLGRLAVRTSPGSDRGPSRRLEDRERRRRGTGLRMGDEDGGQTLGDAQQVREIRFTITNS